MAMGNFQASLEEVLKHEGGLVHNKKDPGGRTNKGVTQRVFNAWLESEGEPRRDVATITLAELSTIYQEQYWDAVRGGYLPRGIDLFMFDYAVNSGPIRAIKALQNALGVREDGVLGLVTLRALQGAKVDKFVLIEKMVNYRMNFLRRLTTWKYFGRGWSRRVRSVANRAKEMVEKDGNRSAGGKSSDTNVVGSEGEEGRK